MNAVTRVLTHDQVITRAHAQVEKPVPVWMTALFAVLVVLSALSVVYTKDLNRRLFIQYQGLQTAANQNHTNWSRLLLAQSTWDNQARVQRIICLC